MKIELIAEKVAERIIDLDKTTKDDHLSMEPWEWPQGIALYALLKYYHYSKEQRYYTYLTNWFKSHLDRGFPERNVNTTAPLLTLAHLVEDGEHPQYLKVCSDWAHWIMEEMPRTREGGLQHITTHDTNSQQLWDDTLFMTVLFLAKMGMVLKRKDYVEEAVRQFKVHLKYLMDFQTKLWYHGWTFEQNHHFGGIFWARGNSWFTSSAVEFIEIAGLEGAPKELILDALDAQIARLNELPHDSGLWHTILNDPSSYLETSGTAGFAYGILKGIRKGYVKEKYRNIGFNAFKGVLAQVNVQGVVQQVSHGTAMGLNAEHYKNIPLCPTAYGQGLILLLLTEGLLGQKFK